MNHTYDDIDIQKSRILETGNYMVRQGGAIVGHLKVERLGWRIEETKRGTPSQSWRFIPTSTTGQQISERIKYNYNYLKDIKQAVMEQANVK